MKRAIWLLLDYLTLGSIVPVGSFNYRFIIINCPLFNVQFPRLLFQKACSLLKVVDLSIAFAVILARWWCVSINSPGYCFISPLFLAHIHFYIHLSLHYCRHPLQCGRQSWYVRGGAELFSPNPIWLLYLRSLNNVTVWMLVVAKFQLSRSLIWTCPD